MVRQPQQPSRPERPIVTVAAEHGAGGDLVAQRVAAALRGHFGGDRVHELAAPVSASEDFGSFGTEWHAPSVFWYVGGTDAETYRRAQLAGRVAEDIPTNHNARFAPVIHPTLETGVEAMTTTALDALRSAVDSPD